MDPGLPQTGDPETYTEDRRCGAWGLALPQMHGTWSTAYAYAVPMRAGTHIQRTSSAARGDVECRDPGSRDPGILMSGIMTRETSRG